MSPSRYIAKIERSSGRELPDPIDPAELLVHAHRDNHPADVAVQFLASRVVNLTGNEGLVQRGVRGVNKFGAFTAEMVGAATGEPRLEKRVRKALGVASRDHLPREEILAVIEAQVSPGTRLAAADDVIENSGGLDELASQVNQLHAKYLEIAPGQSGS